MQSYQYPIHCCDPHTRLTLVLLVLSCIMDAITQALFDFERAVRDFQALVEGDAADRQWSRRLQDARVLRDLTHYQVLGVSQDCDGTVLKKAYRQLCLRWHPDKHTSSAEDQQRANAAFRVRGRAAFFRFGLCSMPVSQSGRSRWCACDAILGWTRRLLFLCPLGGHDGTICRPSYAADQRGVGRAERLVQTHDVRHREATSAVGSRGPWRV
jgi:hypothetical protein